MDRVDTTGESRTLEANIHALREANAKTAGVISGAPPPAAVISARARDGTASFTWAVDGRLHWLGKTTMPGVRAKALIEAFDPGHGNALLLGLNGGAEARALLDRLGPHQAVFIIETDPGAAALALRLVDFSRDAIAGRFVLLAGPDPWDDLADFLRQNDGYLTPERVLAWPWFEAGDIADVTARLHQVGRDLNRDRAAPDDQTDALQPTDEPAPSTSGVALVSNIALATIRCLADRIQSGARELDVPCVRFMLDSPAVVRPEAVSAALDRAQPNVVLVIGTDPGSLPYVLPDAPMCVVCRPDQEISEQLVARLPDGAQVAVPLASQVRQAESAGLDAGRVFQVASAAVAPSGRLEPPSSPGRVLLIADLPDASAKAAGLHLESHRRLWGVARELLADRVDQYVDEDAGDVLDRAARKIGITLESDTVRGGLSRRIRILLGPAVVLEAHVDALLEAAVDLSIFGHGWDRVERFRACHRGPWPSPDRATEAVAGHSAIVAIEPGGQVRPEWLDGMAAGLSGFARTHPLDESGDGLTAVLDPARHAWRFESRAELVGLCRRLTAEPDAFRDKAARAARHILDHHTWKQRIETICRRCAYEPPSVGR